MEWDKHPDAPAIKLLFYRFVADQNCPPDNNAVNSFVETVIHATDKPEGALAASEELVRKLRYPANDVDRLLHRIVVSKLTGGKFLGKQ